MLKLMNERKMNENKWNKLYIALKSLQKYASWFTVVINCIYEYRDVQVMNIN